MLSGDLSMYQEKSIYITTNQDYPRGGLVLQSFYADMKNKKQGHTPHIKFLENNSQSCGYILGSYSPYDYRPFSGISITSEIYNETTDYEYMNELQIGIYDNGDCYYGIQNEAAFRDALGLGKTSGAVPVANGGTGATAKGTTLLSNIGITAGTAAPPSSGTAGTIYIQYT